MQSIARRILGTLNQICEKVFLDLIAQLARPLELLLQKLRIYAKSRAVNLNESLSRHLVSAKEHRNTNNPVSADHADLDRGSVFHRQHNGRQPLFHKIDVISPSIEELLFHFESYW